MAKKENQKLKLGYLQQIMLERTDEDHGITMPEIISALGEYDIEAERKSIYEDLKALGKFGVEVEGFKEGRRFDYRVVSRPFELAELKLLVDAIQSSKFISIAKSRDLIKKLESFASRYEAQQLSRQVHVSGRVKTMNESVYYNLDAIHNAIAKNKQIHFKYFNWNIKKEQEFRKEGALYKVSPWMLSRDDENCYLVAYDSQSGILKYYRVDKMLQIGLEEDMREGREVFEKFDVADYSKKRFGMFDGPEKRVKIRFANDKAGIFIDRFGKDIMIVPAEEGFSTINVDVAVSRQFLAWLLSLGRGVRLEGPGEVKDMMMDFIAEAAEEYRG